MKQLASILFFIVAISCAQAQPISGFAADYQPLQSAGPVPADFQKYCAGKVKKDDIVYKELFSSGLILYGTILNLYVENVVDQLLAAHPDLKERVRVYILRSPEVNALAYENGVVIVNTGLLAQLQNESELAFILAHEIVHIQQGHARLETEAAKQEMKKAGRNETPSLYLSAQYRSREYETEADQLAFKQFFAQTRYSYEALDGVFDLLQYAYLPFNEIPFTRTFVENAYYHFPDEYFLSSVTPICARENYVDTLNSHPNLLKRRAWVNAQVERANNDGRQLFIQPESLFEEVRNTARFECIHSWLTTHDYADAFYNSYVMVHEFPQNIFLQRAIYTSLYGIAMHKKEGQTDDVIPNYKKVEGEKQQVCHFFKKATRNELLLLALRFAYITHHHFQEDAFSQMVSHDILRVLEARDLLSYNRYSDFPMESVAQEMPPAEKEGAAAGNGKYERIRSKVSQREKVYPTEKFKTENYMLADLRQDPAFWNEVDSIRGVCEDEKRMQQLKSYRNSELRSNMVLWQPLYFKRPLGGKKYSEKGAQMARTFSRSCQRLKLSFSSPQSDTLLLSSAESYNHYCKLQAWSTDYLCSQGIQMQYYQSNQIAPTCEAIGADHICMFHSFSQPYRISFKYIWYPLIAAAMIPLSTPIVVTNFFSFEYESKAVLSVIDATTSKVLYSNSMNRIEELTTPYLHDFIYQSLHDVKILGK